MPTDSRFSFARYRLFDFVELALGMLVFAISVFGFWQFLRHPESPMQMVAIFGLSLLSIVFFIKTLKFRAIARDRLFVFSEVFHKYVEVIRNDYYCLRLLRSSRELEQDRLREHVQSTCQQCVDLLARALTGSTKDNVCVCIKYFPEDPRCDSSAIEDYYLKTLCRSYNSSPERDGRRDL